MHAMTDDGDLPNPARGAASAADTEAFGRIFLLILVAEHWTRALALWESLDTASFVYLALATLSSLLAWPRSTARLGFAGLALVQLLVLHRDFPQAGNHAYLELILCLLLALLSPHVAGERQLLHRSVRWVGCLVLFWSGIQKLAHGFYFHGEMLAYSLTIDSFRPVLALLMPAGEMARLSAFTGAVGDGPYRVAGLPFIVVSNAVYATEIFLAGMLLWPRTRRFAVAAALLLLIAIEAAARELFFGLLFANALLLFVPAPVHVRLTPAFAAGLLCLLLVRLGVLPAFVFY